MAMVTSAEIGVNSVLSGFGIRVIAVVQNQALDVTKDILHRVIVRAAFGQADPIQLKFTHHMASTT